MLALAVEEPLPSDPLQSGALSADVLVEGAIKLAEMAGIGRTA